MPDPDAALATQISNIERATGRTVAQWAEVVAPTGLAKHGQIVAFLKSVHGLTHGNANTLAHRIRQDQGGGRPAGTDLLDAQYRGAKAALRPIHDEIVLIARALGGDIDVAIKKTGVSLRRVRQFALIEAPSARRIQLGFNLKDVPPTDRLRATTGMCTHRVDLTDLGDLDDELAGWLRTAYDRAG